MKEWTEQEEQEIIARAKTGDPEANYELSQWALQRSEEEPDEPRWNRLAAKCLVKAAQAGYGPAKEQMDEFLHPGEKKPEQRPSTPRRNAPAEAIPLRGAREAAARRAPTHQTTARRVPAKAPEPEETYDEDDEDSWDDEEDEYDDRPARRKRSRGGRRSSAQGGGRWSDIQWRKMEIICVAVCAVLLVFITVLILTGRNRGGGADSAGGTSAIPPAGEVAPAAGVSAGTPTENLPDEAAKSAIMSSDLDIKPSEEDYISITPATVSVSSVALRMRKGPNTSYDIVTEMPNGSSVSVYAKKNDWFLVLYEGDGSPIYGWCSSEYIILSSGTISPSPSGVPENSAG